MSAPRITECWGLQECFSLTPVHLPRLAAVFHKRRTGRRPRSESTHSLRVRFPHDETTHTALIQPDGYRPEALLGEVCPQTVSQQTICTFELPLYATCKQKKGYNVEPPSKRKKGCHTGIPSSSLTTPTSAPP